MAKLWVTKKPAEGLGTVRTIELPIDKERPNLGTRPASISFDAAAAENDFTIARILTEVSEGDYVYCFADENDKPKPIQVAG